MPVRSAVKKETPVHDVGDKAGVEGGGRAFGVAWIGYALAAAALLWRAWTPSAVDRLLIGGPEGDFLRQFLPYRAFVARTWASGRLPLWNPHQDAGTPAWADPQLAVLYPWRWLQVPLALGGRALGALALVVEAIAHVGLAGALTFGLLRALGARPAAAVIGGLAYALSGYLSGYPLDQLAVLDSAAWVPGILWGLVVATRAATPRLRRRAALLSGAATALALLAGHPQTVAFGLAAGMAWMIAELGGRRGDSGRSAVGARGWVTAALWWLLPAIGLTAAQWAPSWRFLAVASRDLSQAELLAGLPPRDLLQLIAPHALSRWSPLYVGLPVVLLAAWGAVRAPVSRFWLALSAVGALWSLGGNGPLVPLVLRVAPGLLPFRHQERAAVLVALGLAVAAGLAAERLAAGSRRGWREATWLAAVTAFGLALLGGLALRAGVQPAPADGALWIWADATAHAAFYAAGAALVLGLAAAGRLAAGAVRPRAPHPALLALAAVLLLDLLSVNAGHALGPWPSEGPFARDAGVEALAARARDGRVSSEGQLPSGANAAMVHGLYDTTGDSPLHLAPVQRLLEHAPELAWWRILGVRYLVSDRTLGEAEAALLQPLADTAEGVPVYEVGLPAPPTWTTPATRCEDDIEVWRPAPDFDPLAEVVVGRRDFLAREVDGPDRLGLKGRIVPLITSVTPVCGPPGDEAARSGPPTGSARLVGLDPGRAAVEAELPAAAWVVWSSAWDPNGGWRAKATAEDGRERRPLVIPAYGAITAVWLPAGVWRIEWTYRPLSVILGSLISLLSCGLCVVAYRTGRSR